VAKTQKAIAKSGPLPDNFAQLTIPPDDPLVANRVAPNVNIGQLEADKERILGKRGDMKPKGAEYRLLKLREQRAKDDEKRAED